MSSRMGIARRRALQGAGLVGVARDRVGRGLDGRTDRVGPELAAADGIDAAGRSVERLVDPRGEVADRRPEALDLAGARHDPAGPPQDDEESQRQGEERGDGQQDRQVGDGHDGAHPHQPDRARSSARRALPTSNRSPTTIRSAKSAIGASGSRLTATIVDAVCMPTLCWMAPLMPSAR